MFQDGDQEVSGINAYPNTRSYLSLWLISTLWGNMFCFSTPIPEFNKDPKNAKIERGVFYTKGRILILTHVTTSKYILSIKTRDTGAPGIYI